VFFDVRNDSDALYAHYKVRLRGTYDLQILELVYRHSKNEATRLVHGLAKTLKNFGLATREWDQVKAEGLALFAPERGGSYTVFERRPLDPRIIAYCAQDVSLLLELEKKMKRMIMGYRVEHDSFVLDKSDARVALSQTPSYLPKGRHMTLANVDWSGFWLLS
jgi:exonuclease 3'-5' domain-containing protein 1